jgi:hypothetical protein
MKQFILLITFLILTFQSVFGVPNSTTPSTTTDALNDPTNTYVLSRPNVSGTLVISSEIIPFVAPSTLGSVLTSDGVDWISAFDPAVYRVGVGRPYTTIQAALTAIGNSVSADDTKSPKLVSIAGGVYDEDLVIPLGRLLTLQAEGTVVLGNGLGSNWSSTNSRTITASYETADVFGSGVRPALNIISIPSSDATTTFLAQAGTFNISGGITFSGALTRTLNLSSVKIASFTDASVGLTNIQTYRSYVAGTVNAPVAILERAHDSEFDGLITINSYNALINSEVDAGMTEVILESIPAANIVNTPAGSIAATNAQTAINELDTEKEPLITILSVTKGGTGASTLTSNNVILGNGTSAVQFVAPSTTGNVLTSDGTTWISSAPVGGSGITTLNTLTAAIQTFAVGSSGTTPDFVSATSTHTLNIPLASGGGVTSGTISKTDYDAFNGKQAAGNYITALTGDVTATGPNSVAATIANLAVTNAKIANSTIDLTAKVTGTLPRANGGTGLATSGTIRKVLTSDGTDWISDFVDYADLTNTPLNVSDFDNDSLYISANDSGVATLVSGTVTVSNTSITANSRIIITAQENGTLTGFIRVSARTVGTDFTISSSVLTDTADVAYQIIEP